MLTLVLSVVISTIISIALYFLTYSEFWAITVAVVSIIGINILVGRHFLKKLTGIFQSVEKDLRAGRNDAAIEKLRTALPFAKWQFFVKEQVYGQIGIILYSNKKFDESAEYLEEGFSRNWMAMSMKAALAYKNGDMAKAETIMEKCIKNNKKEGFAYSFYAYILLENGKRDKAIEVLTKGVEKNPLDEKLESSLESLKNGKKLKMEKYGTIWLQMHIGKAPQNGAKPYQQFIANQRVKRK